MDLGMLYRDIVESSADGIWVFDGQGRTLYANARIAELTGRATGDLADLTVFDVLDEAGREQFHAHLVELARGQVHPHEVESRWIRRDGSELWVLVHESALYDEDGGPRAFLHRVCDYSDRRRLFEELQQSQQRLAEAQHIAKVGSWEWDVPVDRIRASDELFEMYAVDPTDFGGTLGDFLEMVHPEDRGIVDDAVRRALGGEDQFDFQARVFRGDGTLVWTRGRGLLTRDAAGEPLCMHGTHQDISEAKAGEMALRDLVAQNALMQAMAAAANEAGTLVDALAVAQLLLLRHDDWVRGRGYLPSPERPDGLRPLHLDQSEREVDELQPDVVAQERRLARQSLKTRSSVWDERTNPNRPVIAFPVMLGEEVAAIIVITASTPFERQAMIQSMIDQVSVQLGRVAEREHAARELAAARDAAMEASRQKSDFLATMSHEIRTPLNGVIGLNDLLLRTDLDPHQQRLAAGAQVASRALLGVINDVLDFSKIEAGKLEVEHVDFEVRPIFDQVARVLAESAREKGLELIVSCHPDVPEHLNGDPTRLAQVLTNLGSNAVKFTEAGEVFIRATTTSRSAGPSGAALLRVEVVDTGMGVEPGLQQHIFHPFSQADASTTRRFGGTGLGLAISSEIIAALGGEIGVESEPGTGARFWFTLPLRPATGVQATDWAASRRRDALAGRHMLVVDDNANNRLILSEHLSHWGVTPATASSALQALDMLRRDSTQRPYDAALLDMAMPEHDGLHLAEMIREDPSLPAMPLVMLTSSVEPSHERLAKVGIRECLTKPVAAADLLDALLRVLDEGPERESPGPVAHPVVRLSAERRRLLVVEDNQVNQLVALGILETLGYAADTADDGEQAVKAWRDGSYDAILMDVQMPRMDGYAATRAIRALEADGEHVPVLAMTAAAVTGEREKCLASGMDDFLTKPVNPETLSVMLKRWIDDADGASPDAVEPTPADGVLDLDRLEMLRDLDADSTTYLDKAIGNFVGRVPESLHAIRTAVAAADPAALTQAAHRLKGSALNLGLPAVGHVAFELEMLGDSGSVEAAEPLLVDLESSLHEAVAQVQGYQRHYQR